MPISRYQYLQRERQKYIAQQYTTFENAATPSKPIAIKTQRPHPYPHLRPPKIPPDDHPVKNEPLENGFYQNDSDSGKF